VAEGIRSHRVEPDRQGIQLATGIFLEPPERACPRGRMAPERTLRDAL
jgi:hypothetical protein